jgi:Ca-activated chloride channel family protein
MKKSTCCVSTLAVCSLLLGGSLLASGQHVEQRADQKAKTISQQTKPFLEDKKFTIRERTELVSLTLTVTDRQGRAVDGLSPHDIEIYEDKVKQKIELYSEADSPISVGVVFDLSGSMQRKLDPARQSLEHFVETSHTEDDFFVIGFNRQANLLAEFSDGESARRRLSFVKAQGETALYDAVYLGIEKVLQGRHPRRALLLISDGQDNASRYSLGQVRQRLKEADVQLYAIGIYRPGISEKAELRAQQRGQMILEELAQLTGGQAFFVSTDAELEQMTAHVALELRHQYSLGYTPTNQQRDGQWRKIKVRVNRSPEMPPVIVRVREGYFAAPF